MNKVFAVCSAVPDKEARKLVADTFPNHLVWYPGLEKKLSFQDIAKETKACNDCDLLL